MQIKNSLLVFLSYALGLVLLGGLAMARFPVYATAWFILYLVAGLFLARSLYYDVLFFLANALLGLALFLSTGKALMIGISLVCAYGFLVLVALHKLGKIDLKKARAEREKVKQIIKEVVSEKAPEVEVVSYEKKKAPKKAKKKKKR